VNLREKNPTVTSSYSPPDLFDRGPDRSGVLEDPCASVNLAMRALRYC
jgi:hypothetical protein